MARKVRIETPGFHHIYNRGVEKRRVYEEDEDKERFLKILCDVSGHYDFTIHAYALMDNHYHLLVENRRKNLSDGMRQVNSLYAQYFNKKYDRVGHLWQDRYKSWCVLDERYLLTLFKYFEANPLKAGLCEEAGAYRFTMLADIKGGRIRPCMQESFIFRWYDTKTLLEAMDFDVGEEELDAIEEMKRHAIHLKRSPQTADDPRWLETFFDAIGDKNERNRKIHEAYARGASQSEIARKLSLSVSSISKILKNSKFKP
ncbi:transposase [Hydrogenimonas sp. SS33]|uniref:transposase n=1 Tax=Hydrogenimonas leucolamina TaxID=2954236 RepID=UPI00336BCDD5